MYKDIILRQVELQGEFKGLISSMASDIADIKRRVNNGLTAEITQISKDLAQSVADSKEAAAKIKSDVASDAVKIKADVALSASELRGENWFGRILQGSVTKLIGIAAIVIILSGLTSSGMSLYIKNKFSQDPTQQKQIMEKLDTMNTAPVPLTTADIQNIKNDFVKELRIELDRRAKIK
jgi:hypothetical protein